MSYSGGFGHAPRHNDHSSRRGHTNMERAMTRYESRRGGGPSERGVSPYDLREEYPHTERRSTHGYDRMQENRAHRFPNEGYNSEDEAESAQPSGGNGRQPVRSGNARRLGVAVYTTPDSEPTNYGYDSQNREESTTRFNGRRARRSQSLRTPGSGTRSKNQHVLDSHISAGNEGAEWWAEHDRRHRGPTPNHQVLGYWISNHQILGYWTHPNQQDGDLVFVPNPNLTGRLAALAAEEAANPSAD